MSGGMPVRLEGRTILEGHERILTADADQHGADDVRRVGGPGRAQARMEPDDRLEIDTCPGQLEDERWRGSTLGTS